MKSKLQIIATVLTFVFLNSLSAQSTAFTYQGSLATAGAPASGNHNMRFTLKDAPVGGATIGSSLNLNAVPVTNGIFTVELDFGALAFSGANRWLEIVVNGVTLSPRQKVSAVPYSLSTRGMDIDGQGNATFGGGVVASALQTGSVFFRDLPNLNSSQFSIRHLGTNQSLNFRNAWDGIDIMALTKQGDLGVGTTTPEARLHIRAGAAVGAATQGESNVVIEDSGTHYLQMKAPTAAATGILFGSPSNSADGGIIYSNNSKSLGFRNNGNQTRMFIESAGRVSIGTVAPQGGLSVTNSGAVTNFTVPGVHLGRLPGANSADSVVSIVAAPGGGAQLRFYEQGGDDTRLWYDGSQDSMKFDGPGLSKVSVPVLEIRGGADIVEGFDSVDDIILEPGTVVSIDPDTPGALMRSTDPYDLKVAGIVSGAGGVNPGMHLGQDGVLDGDTKVAMTGRVYVKASDENGPIRPGDRLTTASLPGHAMKATDSQRSDGTVIGKAMSSLDEATGLVLVLVNLQ